MITFIDLNLLPDQLLPMQLPAAHFPNSQPSPEPISRVVPCSSSDFGATFPVPGVSNQLSNTTSGGSKRKLDKRSTELARVSALSSKDDKFVRESVRRTRILYSGLRIHLTSHQDTPAPKRWLDAAVVMRSHGMWLYHDKLVLGHIPGVYVGDTFQTRMELCVVGLHGQPRAGIGYLRASDSSIGEAIATSIVLSGVYDNENNEDSGGVLIYSGHGGQARDKSLRHCATQKFKRGNLAREMSMHYGSEVPVIRGLQVSGSSRVYVYDGLYRIMDRWLELGRLGFGVYKYKLSRIEGQPLMGSSIVKLDEDLKSRPLELKPSGYLTLDVSRMKEPMPVTVFNDIDSDIGPLLFEYLPKSLFSAFLNNGEVGAGCHCPSGCQEGCLCATKNGGKFAYNSKGILFRGKPVVFECGVSCRCPPSCRNRVTQKGLHNRLEIFRSREVGWAVRSLEFIQACSFICEYSGFIFTREQTHILPMTGDSVIYPNRFPGKWAEWGYLSPIFPNYVCPSYPSVLL